jgi:hypothetical protein
MFRSRLLSSGLMLLITMVLMGCGDPQAATNWSRTRVVNALVGIPNNAGINAGINVTVSGNYPTATNLAFGGVSQYTTGKLGGQTVTVTQTGANTALIPTLQVTLGTQQSSTIAVTGVVGGAGLLAPRAFSLVDTAPPTNIASTNVDLVNFAIKVYNLSPDSPAVNLEGGGGVIPGLTNISYGNASQYIIVAATPDQDAKGNPLPTATVALTINATATGIAFNTPTLAKLTGVVNGEIFNVFVIGLVHPTGQQQSIDANVTPGVF